MLAILALRLHQKQHSLLDPKWSSFQIKRTKLSSKIPVSPQCECFLSLLYREPNFNILQNSKKDSRREIKAKLFLQEQMRVLSRKFWYQPTLHYQENLRPTYIKTSKTNNSNRRVPSKLSKKPI